MERDREVGVEGVEEGDILATEGTEEGAGDEVLKRWTRRSASMHSLSSCSPVYASVRRARYFWECCRETGITERIEVVSQRSGEQRRVLV